MKMKHSRWTKEECREEALKYKSKKEFVNSSRGAYKSAYKNKWLDEICSHMPRLRDQWTKDKCHNLALKCKTRMEFQVNYACAYHSAIYNNWLEEVCSHMTFVRKPFDRWTFDECLTEALKYHTRSNFRIGSYSAWYASIKNGWYKEVCSYMKQFLNEYGGYVYEFEDNHFYVGITSREKERIREHLKDEFSSVFKHSKSTGLIPKRKVLFTPTSSEEASKLENWWVNDYIEKGWKTLNISKPGSLGGHMVKWTFDECKKEASKYNTKKEFVKKARGAHHSAYNNGWLDEIWPHMIELIKPSGYWDIKKNCQIEALKYKSKVEFEQNNGSAYNATIRNGWLDEICSHMPRLHNQWTKEKCHLEALKCKSRWEFQNKYLCAYSAAKRRGWLNDICSHMTPLQKPSGYWTKENCRKEASKYLSRSEFNKKSGSAYYTSWKNNWLNEFFPKNK